jgi:hypothetical protein
MPAKSLINMEEATLFSIKRKARFVNLPYNTTGHRHNLISTVLLKEHSHDALKLAMSTDSKQLTASLLFLQFHGRQEFKQSLWRTVLFLPLTFALLRAIHKCTL